MTAKVIHERLESKVEVKEAGVSKGVAGSIDILGSMGVTLNGSVMEIDTSHKDSHKSGGLDAFASTDLLEAQVKRIQESSGPTTLTVGAVADGQFLRRNGTAIIGDAGLSGFLNWSPITRASIRSVPGVNLPANTNNTIKSGNMIYVTGNLSGNLRMFRYDETLNTWAVSGSIFAGGGNTVGLILDQFGDIWFSVETSLVLYKYSTSTHTVTFTSSVASIPPVGFTAPGSLAYDGTDKIYLWDRNSVKLCQYSTVSDTWVNFTPSPLPGGLPVGVCTYHNNDNLVYIVVDDAANQPRAYTFNPSGSTWTEIPYPVGSYINSIFKTGFVSIGSKVYICGLSSIAGSSGNSFIQKYDGVSWEIAGALPFPPSGSGVTCLFKYSSDTIACVDHISDSAMFKARVG